MFFDSFDMIFNMIFIIIALSFCGVVVFLFIQIIKGITQWHQNNQAPQISCPAQVIDKHTEVSVSHHNHGADAGMSHSSSSTTYYLLFQTEAGERLEFHVKRKDFSRLIQHDLGVLHYQGTRFLGFDLA